MVVLYNTMMMPPEDNARELIADLARTFHVLVQAPGLSPWDPGAFDDWAAHPARGESTQHAARFVLAVWDNQRPWQVGAFDLMAALEKWDARNRAAFYSWAMRAWRP